MGDCVNLEKCEFFKQYQKDEDKKYALMGFVRSYWRGDKQDQCVRKKVSKALGVPQKVPVNMMPTGLPLFGTDKKDWSEEVKALL